MCINVTIWYIKGRPVCSASFMSPSGGVVLCDVSRDFFCHFPIFCFSLRAAFHICNRIKNSAGVNKCTGVKRGHALNGEYEWGRLTSSKWLWTAKWWSSLACSYRSSLSTAENNNRSREFINCGHKKTLTNRSPVFRVIAPEELIYSWRARRKQRFQL